MTPTASPYLRDAAARRELLEQVVQLLSLQPDDSPVHNVESYGAGLRVPTENPATYVYALPWARGWSVFVSPRDDLPRGSYSWRHVPSCYRQYGTPVHNPRDKVGAHNVSPDALANAVVTTVERLTHAPAHSETRAPDAA